MAECPLCAVALGPVVAEGRHWRLILNHNLDLLGKCFLTLRRHIESITLVSAEEWTDLRGLVIEATRALELAFAPDHFNYAFLQNQDRHVHLHVMPRYASIRTFGGAVFYDDTFPAHYAVGEPPRRLDDEQTESLIELLRASRTTGT
ncbi:MAG TPA: HIT family protein [Dehalococcoidia bacterium]|nr:HIT family protein [Dehalococcoidia bacterium]